MKKLIVVVILFNFIHANAQQAYNRSIVDTLTSSSFWGRGYTKNGMKKAAAFLANEFKNIGLKPVSEEGYLQTFSFSANTFPGDMKASIDGRDLVPGIDFLVTPESRGIKIKGNLIAKDSAHFLLDKDPSVQVNLVKKLTWSASDEVSTNTIIELDKNRFTKIPNEIKINIDNKFVDEFAASNVCGMVRGTLRPDSFIMITAHYDHLGGMGENTFFPGANDNASGVALLLSLAKYYAAHPQKYSVGFILFAAEEIGLFGSKYYTQHPLFPLKKIRFLTNTDLAGTGDEGITVVNATVFPKEFAIMNKINDENKYLTAIGARGKAANSDHYWFTEKGVPAFFFYTRGGSTAYHDVFDVSKNLPLTEQSDLQELLIKFNAALQN